MKVSMFNEVHETRIYNQWMDEKKLYALDTNV